MMDHTQGKTWRHQFNNMDGKLKNIYKEKKVTPKEILCISQELDQLISSYQQAIGGEEPDNIL